MRAPRPASQALATLEGFADKLAQGGAGVTLEELESYVRFGEEVVQRALEENVGPERERISRLVEFAGVDPALIFTGRFAPEEPAQGLPPSPESAALPQGAAPAVQPALPGPALPGPVPPAAAPAELLPALGLSPAPVAAPGPPQAGPMPAPGAVSGAAPPASAIDPATLTPASFADMDEARLESMLVHINDISEEAYDAMIARFIELEQ